MGFPWFSQETQGSLHGMFPSSNENGNCHRAAGHCWRLAGLGIEVFQGSYIGLGTSVSGSTSMGWTGNTWYVKDFRCSKDALFNGKPVGEQTRSKTLVVFPHYCRYGSVWPLQMLKSDMSWRPNAHEFPWVLHRILEHASSKCSVAISHPNYTKDMSTKLAFPSHSCWVILSRLTLPRAVWRSCRDSTDGQLQL